ncbi:LVIVD repeat-containing protein [Desertivirga arenae]|uniref:LVIVD repeat-containing protein n=1 Tax=Desertivirga arenae TaxID=2810309 RepID=UPI001A97D1D9|nr:hypothetical protein [Pedobacter sp. SYSU D00823]
MKHLFIAIPIFLLLSSCGKDSAGSSDGPSTGAGKGGSLARFATTSTHLYTITSTDLQTYDVSTATNPVFQSRYSLGFDIETIFPKGDQLFIGTQTGMRILDIKDPDAPKQISSFSHIRSCDPVTANDNYAFITLRTGNPCTRGVNELNILNISNITNPTLFKTLPMNEPKGLAVDGNNLFVCDGGIKHYDISNINNIVLKKKTVVDATDVIAHEGKLMVIGASGMYQYDYTSGDLVLLSQIPVVK